MQTSACPLLPPEPWSVPGQRLAWGTLACSPGHPQWSCSARVCPLPICLAQKLSSLLASMPAPSHNSCSQRKHPSRASSTRHSPPGLNRRFLFHHSQQRRVSGLRCSETRPVPTFHALPCFQANDLVCNCSGARQLVTSSRADRMRKQGTGVGVEDMISG